MFCFTGGFFKQLELVGSSSERLILSQFLSKRKQWFHVEESYRSDSCRKGESNIVKRLDSKCCCAQLLPIRCW